MDFSKFDNRTLAEKGKRLMLLDPTTREALLDQDGKPCAVICRGVASRTIQAAMRARQAEAMAKKADVETDSARVMEDMHADLCESAAPYIVGFENVEIDGKPLTAADAMAFLDLTFPVMHAETGADGVVSWAPKNLTFAQQILSFAGGDDFLPETASA